MYFVINSIALMEMDLLVSRWKGGEKGEKCVKCLWKVGCCLVIWWRAQISCQILVSQFISNQPNWDMCARLCVHMSQFDWLGWTQIGTPKFDSWFESKVNTLRSIKVKKLKTSISATSGRLRNFNRVGHLNKITIICIKK